MAEEYKRRISVIDSILSRVPQDVVEHLTNSQKEMLKAINKVIEKVIERIDERVARVKDIRERRK
jgi:hypothetical protein